MVRKVKGNHPFKGSRRGKEYQGQRRLIEEPRQWDVLTIKVAEEKRAAQREFEQRVERPPRIIALVACAAQKQIIPARAADLYTSPLFRRAREYVKGRAGAWYILSALHGLLDPERITAPYNFSLKECTNREREQWAWRVLCELRSVAPPNSHIIILAGKLYREHLEYDLTRYGYTVEVPMRGMGIGQQLRFLISRTRAEVS